MAYKYWEDVGLSTFEKEWKERQYYSRPHQAPLPLSLKNFKPQKKKHISRNLDKNTCSRLLTMLNPANDLLKEVISEGQMMAMGRTMDSELEQEIYFKTIDKLQQAQAEVESLGEAFPIYTPYVKKMRKALETYDERLNFSIIEGSTSDDAFHKNLMLLHFEIGEDCGGYLELMKMESAMQDPIEVQAKDLAVSTSRDDLAMMFEMTEPDEDMYKILQRALEMK